MTNDIGNLAQAYSDGDFTAAIPLLDLLKINGDWREKYFSDLVGRTLTVGTRGMSSVDVKSEMLKLFWMELPGRDERLKKASERHAKRNIPAAKAQQSGSGIAFYPSIWLTEYAAEYQADLTERNGNDYFDVPDEQR